MFLLSICNVTHIFIINEFIFDYTLWTNCAKCHTRGQRIKKVHIVWIPMPSIFIWNKRSSEAICASYNLKARLIILYFAVSTFFTIKHATTTTPFKKLFLLHKSNSCNHFRLPINLKKIQLLKYEDFNFYSIYNEINLWLIKLHYWIWYRIL